MAIRVKAPGREFVISVSKIPTRKRKALCLEEGTVVKPLAYFSDEASADEFDKALEDLVAAIDSSICGGLRKKAK